MATATAVPAVATAAAIAAARAVGATLQPRFPASLPLGVYQHYKNRELYHVLGVVRHTETEEQMVHYQALYHSKTNPDNLRFVRPLSMFLESVTDAQGRSVRRFQLVEEDAKDDTTATAHKEEAEASVKDHASSKDASHAAATTASASSSPAPAADPATAPAAAAAVVPTAPCANPACPTPFAPTMQCSRCRSGVAYCGAACQRADWKVSHQARCIAPASLRLEAVQKLLREKGTTAYPEALRTLARMHTPAVASTLPSGELQAATAQEHALRTEVRSRAFDVLSMYKNPRAIFTGDGDHSSTFNLTFMQALEWIPARCRPAGPFTQDSPMVIYWLGARDDNEGAADFRALEKVLGNVPTLLCLIGPAPSGTRAGLSASASIARYGQLRVRRVVGLYPSAAQSASPALPAPHYAVAFNAGLDAHFDAWAPAIRHLVTMPSPPVLISTGYSTDDSSLQDELILRALGAAVVVPTRISPHGFALMPPHVSNHNMTVCQGRDTTMPSAEVDVAAVKRHLQSRGFHLP